MNKTKGAKNRVHSKASSKKKNIRDLFFRETFQKKPYILDLFSLILSQKEYDLFHWDTLKAELTTYVDESLREKRADLIFSVNLKKPFNRPSQKAKKDKKRKKKDPLLRTRFLFLFEHKSYLDPDVMFQLLKYQASIYEKKEKVPVIPVLFYHGKEEWTLSKNFKDFIIGEGELSKRCKKLFQEVLNFRYRLINLRDLNIEHLPQKFTTRSILFSMKYIESFNLKLLRKAFKLSKNLTLKQKKETMEKCISYINHCSPQRFTWKVLEETEESILQTGGRIMGAFKYSLTQAEEKGLKKGLKKGREEGREEGLFKVALKMLQKEMKVEIISQLTGLSKEQILKLRQTS